jgi:hypothetical protein
MCVYGGFNFPHSRYESVDAEGSSVTIGYISPDTTGCKNSDQLFLEELEELSIQQLVTFPTFHDSLEADSTNTLDLILSDDSTRIYAIEPDAPLGRTPKGRAHVLIKWCIATASKPAQTQPRTRYIWNKANWTELERTLNKHNWEERFSVLETVDECYNDFVQCYTEACDASIPKTTVSTNTIISEAPWMDSTTRQAINKKRASFRRLRAAGKNTRELLKSEYKIASKAIKSAVERFELDMAENMRRNGKDFHAYVNRQQTVSERIHALRAANGELQTEGQQICSILNDCFYDVFTKEPHDIMPTFEDRTYKHINPSASELYNRYTIWARLEKLDVNKAIGPDGIHSRVLKECAEAMSTPLTIIFQRSHIEGRAPKLFKQANVSPIFKKGCKATASNYRPISLTLIACKVQESIQHDLNLEHLSNENLIAPKQHGFLHALPKKSCTTNLLESYEYMSETLANYQPIDVVYMDFSKAFDRVPHKRLLHKLQAYWIRGQLLAWISDWLMNREQRVVYDWHKAEWKKVLSGVPQGSVLRDIHQ